MESQAFEDWMCRSMAKIEDAAHNNAPAVEIFERMRELVNIALNRAQPVILTPHGEVVQSAANAIRLAQGAALAIGASEEMQQAYLQRCSDVIYRYGDTLLTVIEGREVASPYAVTPELADLLIGMSERLGATNLSRRLRDNLAAAPAPAVGDAERQIVELHNSAISPPAAPAPAVERDAVLRDKIERFAQKLATDRTYGGDIVEDLREMIDLDRYGTPPAEAREPVGDATLWALHIEGPDDVHPAPSREMAQEAADLFNATFPQSNDPNWPRAVAKVIEWPHGARSHALSASKFVANWLTPTTIRGSAATRSPTGEPTTEFYGRITPDEAREAARSAGIIDGDGKLQPPFAPEAQP